MELKEMIKVMQHYENGGEVECSLKPDDDWITLSNYCWDWHKFKYRIKEQKQKVTIEKWLIKDVNNGEYFIIGSSDVNLNLKVFPEWRKLKLIESYEVEL